MGTDRTLYAAPSKTLGRPRTTALREVVNAILYLLRSGCPWRLLPKDFPTRSTVQRYCANWRDSGLWARINHQLLMATREAEGQNASPSTGVIDSQSVKTTESGAPGVLASVCHTFPAFLELRHVLADAAYADPN